MKPQRDAETGEWLLPLSIDVHLPGAALPHFVRAANWASVIDYLQGSEFATLAEVAEFVTITDAREPEERRGDRLITGARRGREPRRPRGAGSR